MIAVPRMVGGEELPTGTGSRELLSALCEVLARDLGASGCLVSWVDLDRRVAAELAAFTRSPERWRRHAGERALEGYPATRAVIDDGRPYTTWVGDRGGDRAEPAFLDAIGDRAALLLRLDGAGGPYLVEVWSDMRSSAFGRGEVRRARRIVRAAGRLLPAAAGRDFDEAMAFLRAADHAREIGAADLELPVLAAAVGEGLCLDEAGLRQVRLVALVHEAGISHIPAPLRAKRGPLTPVERAVVQRHTLIGQRMLAGIPELQDAVAGVGAIREWWDGSGYPHGLRGEAIPLTSRIVAVCAAYVVMRRGNARRRPLLHEQAVAELDGGAGTQFDPEVVAVALRTIHRDGVASTVRLRVAAI